MTTLTPPRATPQGRPLPLGTARTTGLLYLAVGICGALGFLVVRPMLLDPQDPAATLANLLDHERLARAAIALDLVLVIAQVLVALWFFRLFRAVDPFAAGAIGVFGVLNAVFILGSTACVATALDLALATPAAGPGEPQVMYLLSQNLWGVGNLFFGLWLVPMGWCALRCGWLPRTLGRLLLVGGAGYVLSCFTAYLVPEAGALTGVLVVPATIGELWMIGALLLLGVRSNRSRVG